MKQVPIKLGPLALLLTVISICLTVLSILAFTTARADLRLAERSAETLRERYALELQGQSFLRELADTDPADYSLMDLERDRSGVWHTEFREGEAVLRIGFRPSGDGSVQVVSWRMEKDWTEDDSLGELWDGGF